MKKKLKIIIYKKPAEHVMAFTCKYNTLDLNTIGYSVLKFGKKILGIILVRNLRRERLEQIDLVLMKPSGSFYSRGYLDLACHFGKEGLLQKCRWQRRGF